MAKSQNSNKPAFLRKKTFLTTIKASTGSRMFRKVFVEDQEGQESDLLSNGEIACAYYVSVLLKWFDLIPQIHTTIETTLKEMEKAGWVEVNLNDMQPCDVLVWEKDGDHYHMGFYVGSNMAISNSSSKKAPLKHPYDYLGKRPIVKVWRYGW